MVCLRESLPEVREQIQNLADKLGVDYGTAKIILLENNGYDLDKAPNGAESKLYKTLLDHFNGDEIQALKAKAKTYLQPFFDWFGNWTDSEATDVSKVVDGNGEPLLVYHSSDQYFEEFKHGVKDNTGARDSKNLFFFSSDQRVSSWYTDMFHGGYNKYTNLNTVDLQSMLLKQLIGDQPPLFSEREWDDYTSYAVYPSGVVVERYSHEASRRVQLTAIDTINTSEWFNSLPVEMQDELKKKIHFDDINESLIEDIMLLEEYNESLHRNYDESAGVSFDALPLNENILYKYFIRGMFLNIKDLNTITKFDGKVKRSIVDIVENNLNADGFVIKNTNDSGTNILSDIFAVRQNNQIKPISNLYDFSAIENTLDEISIFDTSPRNNPFDEFYKPLGWSLGNSETERIFNEFMDRIAFDVEHKEGLTKPVIDVANKIFQIGEYNDQTLAKSMAELGWALLDKYTQREIVKHYGKSKLLGGDITDNIIYDLQKSIEKGVATNFEKSWFDKIMKKLAEFIGRMFKNRMTYFAAIDSLAESIATNHDGYFDQVIKEGFEQKNITLEDIHSTKVGKVYDILTSDKFNGTLGGSAAIRLQGTLYRQIEEDFHDLDFTMPYSKFSWDIHEAIGRFYENKKMNQPTMGWVEASKQAREQLLKEADVIFKRSELFKVLSENFQAVNLKNVFYTPKNGICFTFEVDGFPVDLFFSKDVQPLMINGIKISHFSVSFAAKVIMARPKDMRDIINFRKFNRERSPEYYNAVHDAPDSVYAMSDETRKSLTSYPKQGIYHAKQFMQTMLTSGEFFQDPVLLEIALKLFEKIPDAFEVVFSNDNDYDMACSGNTITVTLGALRNLNTYQFGHRFMHEIMHPIVRDAAGKGGYLYEAIERVRKDVLSKLTEEERKDLTFYGLTDSKEFASEIFTNPFFRDELVKRYSPKGWRKLLQNILNFFGFKKIANKVAQNSEYIYNEISKIVDNYTGDLKHDLLVGKQVEFYSPNLLNQLEKDAKNEIKKIQMGLKNRLKVLKSAANQDPARMVKLQELIYKYENLLVQGEIQQCFVDFIKSANPVYNSILQKVRRAANDLSTISNDELVLIKNDFIDFYGPVIKECNDNLFVNGYFDSLPVATKAAVAKNLNLIERAHIEIQSKWGLLMKDKAAQILRTHGEAQGRPTEDIDNYLNDELNQTDSDLNFYSRFIQSAGRVSDIAISTMFRVMSDCNRQVIRFANGVLQDLKTTMDLLGIKRRDLLNFFEKDNKGRSTGYLIRPLNYGLANADYRAFLTSLNEKYGISADEVNGLPDDEFIEYHREKERWLCDHYERKFKSAYYLAYAELSPTTKQVLRDINDEIKHITDTVSSPTGARLQDLSDADYKKLTALYKLKRDLANPYDENGNIKFGDDLKIAEELTNFNNVISGGFSNNYTLQQVIDLIDSKKRSMSAAEFLKWYDRNVVIGYSKSFSNWLQSIGNKGTYGAEYISLLKEKNALLKHGKDNATPYVDAAKLTAPVKRRIFQIDQRLSEIRFMVNGPSNGITQNALGYISNGQFIAVAKIEPTLRYYSDKAIAQSKGQGAFQLWVAENHVDGQPASYYTKLVPVTLSDIEFRLNPMNQELSADSPLMNPAFDFNSNESRQPKVSLYDNGEAYTKATEGNKKVMYDLFVQTMSEANAKLPWLDNQSPYKLPQKTGDMIDYLWRSKRNIFKSLWDYSADAITIRPDDPGYALDNFSAKPGGGLIDFVPTYYVRDLDNPEYISRNLLGIIAEYARMAENYRVKQERQGEFMVIDEALAGRDVVGKKGTVVKQGGRDTHKYKKYHELLNMQLYGRMFKEIVWDLGFFRFKFPIKLWKNTISYATLLGLSWNRNSIVKSFWLAHIRTITEAIGGRYFDSLDLLSAIGQQIMYLPKWFVQLGNPYANDFSIALMQHLNIAREFTLNTEDLQYNRLFRIGSKYGLMGGWSFIDYFVKTPIIKAVAANFRLDPTTGKFMPKHKFINKYYADDRKTGEKEFYKLKTRWLNVVTSVNGKIVPKKGYESLADAINDKETVNLLTNIGEFITNRIDGKISEEDKTQWMTSIIGSAACMHRWYYIFNLDDNYATRHQYNPMIEDNYEARFLSVAKVIWKGLLNLGIMFLNLFGASKQYKLVESVTMYNFRRSLGHLLTLGSSTLLMYSLIYPFIFSLKAGDDDDDEGFLKNIPWEVKRVIKKILIGSTAAAEGAVQEEYSEYPTVSFNKGFMQPDVPMLTQILQDDVQHTITPAYSLVDTYEAIFSSRGKTLRSGSYAGMTDTLRNIIRAVPGLRNLMDFTNVSPALNMVRKNRTPLFWELNSLFKPETKKPERKSKGFEVPIF